MVDFAVKPAVSNIWGNSAGAPNLVAPPQSFVETGWPLSSTPPSRQYFNWLENYTFNAARYFARRGMTDYDPAETYRLGDTVRGDDGALYKSLQNNQTNNTPSTSATFWGPVTGMTPLVGDVSQRLATTAFVQGAMATYKLAWVDDPTQVNYRLATLPISGLGTFDSVRILVTLNSTWGASQSTTYDILLGNRNGFAFQYDVKGPNNPNCAIVAYLEGDGSVNIYAEAFGTNFFAYANITIINVAGGVTLYANPAPAGDSGTIIFNTAAPATYPPLNAPGGVLRFGAVPGSDAAAAVTANTAAGNAVVEFPAGAWPMATTPSLTTPSLISAKPGSSFSGSGAIAVGLVTGGPTLEQEIVNNTTGGDFASRYLRRNANHSGGSFGFVSSCLRVETYVTNAGATNFEWSSVAKMDNSATAGENVASYMQAIKRSTGPTWGANTEVIESSHVNDPLTGTVCHEFDMSVNGTDTHNTGTQIGNRIGCDLVVRQFDISGGAPFAQAGYGFRIQNGSVVGNSVGVGFSLGNGMIAGVGFDTSIGTILQAAYKMATGQVIALSTDASQQFLYDGSGLTYQNNPSGTPTLLNKMLAAGGYQVGAHQVIGAQIAGWGTSSGGTRGAITTGATLAQVVAALAQLLIDLKTHGLVGT